MKTKMQLNRQGIVLKEIMRRQNMFKKNYKQKNHSLVLSHHDKLERLRVAIKNMRLAFCHK